LGIETAGGTAGDSPNRKSSAVTSPAEAARKRRRGIISRTRKVRSTRAPNGAKIICCDMTRPRMMADGVN
jgi:hypothetical protein